ncbi:hypothetical protein KBB08_00560 [Candidatus Gracilibacteria bacterium]|nr:hypothetical protein [Candidatus Gracilibacteria bacterium]
MLENEANAKSILPAQPLVRPKAESGTQPLSRQFLLDQGRCCHSGCVNCPYPLRQEGKLIRNG